MNYLDKNYVSLDVNDSPTDIYYIGKVKNTTEQLYKVFGVAIQYTFRVDGSKFTIEKEDDVWILSTDTLDKDKKNYFTKFLTESKGAGTSRGVHQKYPEYPNDYQLKHKIGLFHIPVIKPPAAVVKKITMTEPIKNVFLHFDDYPDFRPNLTPKEVLQAGSFGGTYFREILSGVTGLWYKDAWKEFPSNWFEGLDIDTQIASQVIRPSINKYQTKAGGNLDMWESSGWIAEIDPYGWFQWYCRFYLGRRSTDDERQIKRWSLSCGTKGRFRTKLLRQIISNNAKYNDYSIGPAGRQGMLHWGYEITSRDLTEFKKYNN